MLCTGSDSICCRVMTVMVRVTLPSSTGRVAAVRAVVAAVAVVAVAGSVACVRPVAARGAARLQGLGRPEAIGQLPRREVLDVALRAYECGRRAGAFDTSLLTVIDYSLPSTRRRLWVIDVPQRRVLFHELVAHGETGTIVPADDADALAETLLAFARDADAAHAAGRAARARAERLFSLDAMVAQYAALYERLLRGRKRRAAAGSPLHATTGTRS